MRNSLHFILFLLFFFFSSLNVLAVEPLVKYNIEYQRDANGNRIPDSGPANSLYRNTGLSVLNPNSIMVGSKEDCYPDDLNNPDGNILISGSVVSKDTNLPVTGAVVAVYMGSEHTNNITNNIGTEQRFVVGEGERLSNLYYYDITKDGKYTIYACNDYKKLSEDKIRRYGSNFCVDGYTKTGDRCTHFDYTKAYPKFYVAVICGMSGYEKTPRTNDLDNYRKEMENAKLKPWIGEILSIDNYNEPYKGANRPDFLSRKDFTIKVNCSPTLAPFPVPMFLEYTSNNNVASCRMDDVSPDLVNYFKKIQEPLRSSNYSLANSLVQGSTKIPSISTLTDCTDPEDPLCAKNFITKAFPVPDKQKNLYNYGNKAYLEDSTTSLTSNPVLRNEVFSYNTSRGLNSRKIDFEYGNSADGRDYLAKTRSSTEGQVDAKLDAKTMIDDVKFDITSLKDLYACFTTFNFPLNRSSADFDEVQFSEADPTLNKYFTPNLRIPSCRELYCGGKYLPENEICKVPIIAEDKGTDTTGNPKKFSQINTLTGYGPGVTMTLKSKKDITLELMKLVNELVASDFNPKKNLPGVKYKPVEKVTDIIACYADDGKPVLLNSDGSITYQSKLGSRNFYSPVPMISFLSIPYNIEFLHAITNDNYANKTGNTTFFSEECNYSNLTNAATKDKNFANCRSAVIPGGVYSISALRVISKMCTDNTKLPTSNNGVFSNKIETSKVEEGFGRVQPNEKRVELAITRIGTPSSLCLCDPNSPTPGCNLTTKLNSVEKPQNYGVASFVGTNDQNKGNNFLGSLCNMTKKDSKDTSCSEFFSNRGDLNVKTTPNYIGGMNNIAVAWTYSYKDMDANFLTDKFFHHVTEPGSNIPQTNQGALPSLNVVPFISVVNGAINEGTFESDKACLELYKSDDDIPAGKSVGDCKSYAYFKQEVRDQNISSMEKDFDIPKPTETETPTVGLNEVAPDPVTGEPYLKNIGYANLYQKTKDGTSGYVYTKFDYLNQKYDPIPELLNDFRRYSTWGIIPGGNAVCRTPKLATLVDFKTTEMTNFSRKDSDGGGGDLNFAISRGLLCNEVIPEELDRCETGDDIILQDKDSNHGYTPPEECKLRKCLTLCNQLYPTYEFYSSRTEYFNQLIESSTSPALTVKVPTDPATGNPVPHYQRKGVNERVYFCKNSDPKAKNVALEMNKGDEGCVLDYSRKIREVYTLPKVLNDVKYKEDPLYAKFNYPVYNNQLCINPVDQLNFSGKSRDSLVNDSKNCKPFIGPQRPQDF